jgi:glycosyltransferase involved in cell wall biosynthesis
MTQPPALALSVCICTYNGAARIGAVLEALGRQTRTAPDWEVVVVNNASRDQTAAVVATAFAAHLPGRGRLVDEAQPGVTFARRRAALEARGHLLAYLDDDTLPAPDFVACAVTVMQQHPEAGLAGGKIIPDWLEPPTPVGVAIADFALAICDRGDQPFAYPDVTGGPVTAGMVARTEVLRTILSDPLFTARISSRVGDALDGGEDTAIVIRCHQLGHTCRYEPSLVIRHQIPAARTALPYLLRFYQGIGHGQAMIRYFYDWKARVAPLALLIALKEGLRWLAGEVRGPSAALREKFGAVAADVHRLQQRQVYGRFRQGLREPFR